LKRKRRLKASAQESTVYLSNDYFGQKPLIEENQRPLPALIEPLHIA
jgi:hypothetical protein